MDCAFPTMKLWTRVRALKNITTKNRTMKKGDTGTVLRYWPYMVAVRPDGKKLLVETNDQNALEVIVGDSPNK